MRHIHISIVSRHLATRGNNKILRTPPPHISSSEERHPRLTRRTLAHLRTNKSPFLKSYFHKVDAKTHPSPLCPLCNIHTHDTHHLFNCTHIRTTLSPLDWWTDPAGVTALLARWMEKQAGGSQVGTSDNTPPPPHWQGSKEWVDNNMKEVALLHNIAQCINTFLLLEMRPRVRFLIGRPLVRRMAFLTKAGDVKSNSSPNTNTHTPVVSTLCTTETHTT